MTAIELPSLKQINEMEQIKAKYISELQYDKKKQFVRCQTCNEFCRIFEGQSNLSPVYTHAIIELKKRIEFAKSKGFNCNKDNEEELNRLLEKQKRTEILTRLPLYSTKITGWKWVCGKCYDEIYLINMHNMHA